MPRQPAHTTHTNPLLAAPLAHSLVNTGHCTSVYVQHKYKYSTQYTCTDRYGLKISTNNNLMYAQYNSYAVCTVGRFLFKVKQFFRFRFLELKPVTVLVKHKIALTIFSTQQSSLHRTKICTTVGSASKRCKV
jgi:hypothetical protein